MIEAARTRNAAFVEAGTATFLVASLEDVDLGERRKSETADARFTAPPVVAARRGSPLHAPAARSLRVKPQERETTSLGNRGVGPIGHRASGLTAAPP